MFLERIPLSRLVSIVSEEATQLCLHAAGYSVSAGQMEAMLGGNAFDAYNYSNYQHHMDRYNMGRYELSIINGPSNIDYVASILKYPLITV